jgi:hypothetical protein
VTFVSVSLSLLERSGGGVRIQLATFLAGCGGGGVATAFLEAWAKTKPGGGLHFTSTPCCCAVFMPARDLAGARSVHVAGITAHPAGSGGPRQAPRLLMNADDHVDGFKS